MVSIFLTPYNDGYLLFTAESGAAKEADRHHLDPYCDGKLGTDTETRNGVRCQLCDIV